MDRRIPDEATVKAAWNRDRNAAASTIDWRFTTADARIKLKHLYPAIYPRLPTRCVAGGRAAAAGDGGDPRHEQYGHQ